MLILMHIKYLAQSPLLLQNAIASIISTNILDL